MVINQETEAEILRLYHAEKWRIGTIARQLRIHHVTVERVLANNGIGHERLQIKPSKLDPFLPFIRETLTKYPDLSAVRLHEMLKQRGYEGSGSHFRNVLCRHRPRPIAEAYMRTATLPGEQAQCDWAHFGKIKFGNAERRLLAFVMVMSWSRHIFLRFYTGDAMPNFLRGHVDAFEFYGAVPRTILYDNLRSAVLERFGSAIRFNPELLALAAHYRFLPKPVAVAQPNQKGKVERAIRYARSSFFAARKWRDLEDLNTQALKWCVEVAGSRRRETREESTVVQSYEQEKSALIALPPNPYPAFERKEVHAGKTPYVRFDLNDYSIPHQYVRRTLTVLATPVEVKVLHGIEEIAKHERSYDRGLQIENPVHVEDLAKQKEAGRKHRAIDMLRHACPSGEPFLKQAAMRNQNLGRLTQELTKLLGQYGPTELESAIRQALQSNSIHASAVRQGLENNRSTINLKPPVTLSFAAGREANDLIVVPRSLDVYDKLFASKEDGDE